MERVHEVASFGGQALLTNNIWLAAPNILYSPYIVIGVRAFAFGGNKWQLMGHAQ